MSDSTKNIREFLYLDVPRLYSLYSQMFQGVTERITEERITQELTGDAQKTVLRGASSSSEALERAHRTESIVLHDYMYNRLEEALSNSLYSADEVTPDSIRDLYIKSPLIKVSGVAEIEDYDRLRSFLYEFNNISDIIAYANIIGDEATKSRIIGLTEAIRKANSSKRKELERQLDELTDARSRAVANNLYQDQKLMDNLRRFIEIFNPNGYDVVIVPPNRSYIHFRGILDKAWLRISAQLISNTYGGVSSAPWSMVGFITHIPKNYEAPSLKSEVSPFEITPENTDNPMMLDAYRNMFRNARIFEQTFLESRESTEVILQPLAIYREFELRV